MPYDDSDVKKMIRYQIERKVGFSKSKKVSEEAKFLIHGILEAKVDRRYTIREINDSVWLQTAARKIRSLSSHSTLATSTPDSVRLALHATDMNNHAHYQTSDPVREPMGISTLPRTKRDVSRERVTDLRSVAVAVRPKGREK